MRSEQPDVASVARYVVAAAVAMGYVLLRCGFGTFPSLQVFLDISASYPTILEITPMGQYLHYSPAGPVLAHLLGIETLVAYQLLHVAVFVVSATVVLAVIARRHGSQVALLAVVAFITSQAVVVMTAWVGSYDVFTWAFGSAIVLVRGRIGSLIIGFLAAFAAFEQTLISVGLLALGMGAGRSLLQNRFVPTALGLVLGRLYLELALRANGAGHDRLDFLREAEPAHFVEQFTDQLPLFLVTAFGGAWIVLVCCLLSIPSRERIRWIVALTLAVVPCLLGEDQTRIYALITWPLVLAITLRAGGLLSATRARRASVVALVAGLVIPPIYLWAGTAFLSDHHLWHALT